MDLDGRLCIEPSFNGQAQRRQWQEKVPGFGGLCNTGQGQAVFSPAVFCHPTWLWPDIFRESSMRFISACLILPFTMTIPFQITSGPVSTSNLNHRSNWFNTNQSNKRGWTGDKKTAKVFRCTSAKISKTKCYYHIRQVY